MSKFQSVLDKIDVDKGFTLEEVQEIHTNLEEIRENPEDSDFEDADELSKAFYFGNTTQGVEYWYDIAVRLGEYPEE